MKQKFNGPLKVHPANPRYFTDNSNKAILLTGAHTWFVFHENREQPLDYDAYLDFLEENNYNFMRFWTQENAICGLEDGKEPYCQTPLLYKRTGPGLAADGKPKFDLTQMDEAYFELLRSKLVKAGERGIYSAVMLFQGWGIERKDASRENPWPGHAFNINNNINGINGDPDGTGEGTKVHTLEIPEIVELQKAYIRKVIDAVNDLDHILYEISNESASSSAYWQYEMIRFIKEYEKSKPKQHPVLMTYSFPDGNNYILYNSDADAISPGGPGCDNEWNLNPPASDGRKVILLDTDHIGGIWGTGTWVWKAFMRGLNPIFMDDALKAEWKEPVYQAMSDIRRFAEKIDLSGMLPSGYLTSTGYCLAKPDAEYLIYQPEIGQFTVRLLGTSGTFEFEWYDPGCRKTVPGKTFKGGEYMYFTAPFRGDAVLYIKKKQSE